MHGRREVLLVRRSALRPGESHALDPRCAARPPSLPLLSARDAAGNGVRMRLDGFSCRPLALRLRLHVPGTSAPALPGLLLHTVSRALPSLLSHDETPRRSMNGPAPYGPRSAHARQLSHLPPATHPPLPAPLS